MVRPVNFVADWEFLSNTNADVGNNRTSLQPKFRT